MSKTVRMDVSDGQSFMTPTEAYERLLHHALVGDHTLVTRDGGERAWEVVAPVLDRPGPPQPYPAGSWRPAATGDLLARRRWDVR